MVAVFLALLAVSVIGWGAGDSLSVRSDDSKCGDWTSYKDEKCIKISTDSSVQTYRDAEEVCKAFADTLVPEAKVRILTIKTKEEQEFLEKLLFEVNTNIDNVWLGIREARNESGIYEWMDGTKLSYENWATDSVHDTTHGCVQMTAGRDRDPLGKWLWASCLKRNDVVCERALPVTLNTLISWFTSHKVELERAMDASDQKIAELENELGKVETAHAADVELLNEIKENGGESCKNNVPKDFVYVQLSGMAPPQDIWPDTEWDDISAEYAGLFFRVAGGNSTDFDSDTVQEASTVRLAAVESIDARPRPPNTQSITIPEDGAWSEYLTGAYSMGRYTRYRVSTDEIRPRNKAVKIWRRVEGDAGGDGDKDTDEGNEDKDEHKEESFIF